MNGPLRARHRTTAAACAAVGLALAAGALSACGSDSTTPAAAPTGTVAAATSAPTVAPSAQPTTDAAPSSTAPAAAVPPPAPVATSGPAGAPTPTAQALAGPLPRVIRGGPAPGGRKVVYLTFDDGPSKYTPAILDALKRGGATATFFVIGGQVDRRASLVRRAAAEGNLVANHTWSHPILPRLTDAQIRRQIAKGNRAIVAAGLPATPCLRPPYGITDARVRRDAAGLVTTMVLWNVDSRDWTRPGAARIASRVVSATRPGSIVLMHDGGGDRAQTIAALPRIISGLRAKGYTFATIPSCA